MCVCVCVFGGLAFNSNTACDLSSKKEEMETSRWLSLVPSNAAWQRERCALFLIQHLASRK